MNLDQRIRIAERIGKIASLLHDLKQTVDEISANIDEIRFFNSKSEKEHS